MHGDTQILPDTNQNMIHKKHSHGKCGYPCRSALNFHVPTIIYGLFMA